MLIGDDPDALGGARLYIGESDVLAKRLRNHDVHKDFWDRVVLVASSDDNLTKAHVRYLEAQLIKTARTVERAAVENGTAPDATLLPEADVAVMNEFLSNLQLVLPVLGINLLRGRSSVAVDAKPGGTADSSSPIFRLAVPKVGIDARAQEVDGEFTVLAGSTVASEVRAKASYAASTASAYAAYEATHRKLREEGSIDASQNPAVVSRDIPFKSPSTAGAIVTGRSCNGRQAWVTDDGQTYGGWEERGLSA